MQKRTLTYPAYQVSINVIWADNLAEAAESVRREVPKLDAVDEIASAAAMCLHSKKRPCEAWLIFSSKPTPGEIAHEAVHAANLLLMDVGVQVTQKNDEAHAYFVQWIVDEVSKPRRKKT